LGDSPQIGTGGKISLKEEITKAIGAHGLWKARLKTAIDTGKLLNSVRAA
jgi:hypothetical protein